MSIAGHQMFHIYILPIDASMALNDIFSVHRRELRVFSGGQKIMMFMNTSDSLSTVNYSVSR